MNYQKKILVIDGDQNFLSAITESLTFHNYKVRIAFNSSEGIKEALEFIPDLILCEIDIHPVTGYQVYAKLNDSYILKRTPFVFLKQKASIKDIRHGMNLGADDFFSKPVNMQDLVHSIEIRLQKFEARRFEFSDEFNALFQLSPIGIILFNEHVVVKANQFVQTLLKIDKSESINSSIEDLFDGSSLPGIKNWLQQSLNGIETIFNESIIVKDLLGEELKLNLIIYNFSTHSNFIQFIGFLTPSPSANGYVVNDQLANQICTLLKREKITLTDGLQGKITNFIKRKTGNYNNPNNSFFTRRENQVLNLSMEGLPIKIIADKLSISTRTVEKYRTKLMEKSGANNIVEVIVFSLKNGLIKI